MDLGKSPLHQLIKTIAIPAMVAQCVNVAYSIVDRIYIGHMADGGSLALAAIGVCGPLVTLIGAFAALVGVGGAPLCSMAMGEGKLKRASKLVSTSFFMVLTISIILVLLLFPFRKELLLLFGASNATIDDALTYFTIYLCGTPLALVASGMNYFINAQGYSKIGMTSVLVGALVNIILDPILIYGFTMGVAGAAIATVFAQGCSAVFVLAVLVKAKLPVKLKFNGFDQTLIRSILKIGFTPFAIIAFDNVMIMTMNTVLKFYPSTIDSDLLISANTIAQSFMLLVTMPLGGISSGTQCILSYNYGAFQCQRVKEAYRQICQWCVGFTILMFAFVWLAGDAFVSLFTSDPLLKTQSLSAIRTMTWMIIPLGLQYELVDGMTALGQVKISFLLSFFRKGVYFAALLLVPLFFGAESAFVAEPISDLIAPIFSFIIVKRNLDAILQWRASMAPIESSN